MSVEIPTNEHGAVFPPQYRGEIVSELPNFPVLPSDIDTAGHFFNAFGNMETEFSANWIVKFCQTKNSWDPFTYEEINNFYNQTRENTNERFTFNALIDPIKSFSSGEKGPDIAYFGPIQVTGTFYPVGGGWIVHREGKYLITTAFVETVYKSSQRNQEIDNKAQ